MNRERYICVIANKWWEAVPLVTVLSHPDAVPSGFEHASVVIPLGANRAAPRARLRYRDYLIDVWCLQDLMDAGVSSSSSWEKARVLPQLRPSYEQASLVIAFGTCACPLAGPQNGNVVCGSRIFVHDPYSMPPDPTRHWEHELIDTIITSPAGRILDAMPTPSIADIERRSFKPPNVAAEKFQVYLGSQYVASGVVNVTNHADYQWADRQALEKFDSLATNLTVASHETTHGLIRLVTEAPFIYVSGIANGVEQFSTQVAPNPFTQNMSAAHNAAVALAWLLPSLVEAL